MTIYRFKNRLSARMQDLKSRNTFENDMRLSVVISSSSQLLSITPLKYRDFLEKCAREYTVFLLTNLPAEMPKLPSFSTVFRTHLMPYRPDFCNFLQLAYRHENGLPAVRRVNGKPIDIQYIRIFYIRMSDSVAAAIRTGDPGNTPSRVSRDKRFSSDLDRYRGIP